jgi:hypothetical protein
MEGRIIILGMEGFQNGRMVKVVRWFAWIIER